MYTKEKLLTMLTSRKASVRYDACEWLRVWQESSPEIIRALERAAHDEDKEVEERARFALMADAHRQMALKMGIISPYHSAVNHNLPIYGANLINNKLEAKKDSGNPILFGLFGIIFVTIGVWFFLNALSTQRLINSSKTWPEIKGEVISSKIKYNPSTE
jgi:hypothetical protein